jgi:ElaB/YqjD/DUF883 family membrane-anchored ribosome-binding protein
MADTVESGAPETVTETVTSSAESARDAARARFQRLSSDVQDRYRRVSDDVRRGAERASDELRRGAEQAREHYEEAAENVRRGYTTARRKADHYGGELNEYVRDNPGRSVLIAAGVGFLVGLLVRARRSDDI